MYTLNDQLACTSIEQHENWAVFVCEEGTSLSDMQALDGQTITVTNGEENVAVFAGYSVCGTWSWEPDGLPRMRIVRELSDQTEAAITGLDANVSTARAIAEAAKQTAQSAMETAQEAGTDAQVKTIAKLTAASIDFANVTATDCVAIPDYIPEWSVGMSLAQNDPVMRNGQLYRASQAIPSSQEQYPPETAGESLYYPVEVAPDGIIVYRECHGQYDMVRKGEKRHYPGASDPVYIALEDTAYSPDAYPQHWELDQAEAE